jgi:hypothetical protein
MKTRLVIKNRSIREQHDANGLFFCENEPTKILKTREVLKRHGRTNLNEPTNPLKVMDLTKLKAVMLLKTQDNCNIQKTHTVNTDNLHKSFTESKIQAKIANL